MNRKKKPTEEVKMSTWEVFRRLVRDARPIYGWLLLGALLGGIVVACTVIAPQLPGPPSWCTMRGPENGLKPV